MRASARIAGTATILSMMARPAWAFQVPQGRTLTAGEIALSVGALVFAMAIVAAAAWMRIRKAMSGDATFKLIGLAIVVGAALCLLTAGYSQDQMTPVAGILGTALGFVFGKNFAEADPSRNPPKAGGLGDEA